MLVSEAGLGHAGGPAKAPFLRRPICPLSVLMSTVPRDKRGALPEVLKPPKVQHELPNAELPIVDSITSVSSGNIHSISENHVLELCGHKTLFTNTDSTKQWASNSSMVNVRAWATK